MWVEGFAMRWIFVFDLSFCLFSVGIAGLLKLLICGICGFVG